MLDNFEIILCPTPQSARNEEPDITIEAEYGTECVEGKLLTLAHHGDRSNNPAPCDTDIEPFDGGKIVVSHLDIDTIGGIMAVTGDKFDDPEFWKGAAYIDVQGPHHMYELSNEVQDKLNAIYAWNAEQPRGERITEPTSVIDKVKDNYHFFEKVLDKNHPEHGEVIEKGRSYESTLIKAIEDRCVFENEYLRAFKTDGLFCASSYYSEQQKEVILCTVTYNEKFKSITVAFADGGRENGGEHSAKEIVQHLWGPEAGGRDGIGGSPRDREMTENDFKDAINYCLDKIIEHKYEKDIEKDISIGKDR